MNVIGLLKQKGGTGATTIAVHLALAASEAGRRVCIVDLDPQQSARMWADARGDDYPPVVPAEPKELRGVLIAARKDGFDLVLIDTPPHSSASTADAARVSTLAVIPVRPSALDLGALPATLDIVRATRTPTVAILNACLPRAPELQEARDVLAQAGVTTWDGEIGMRRQFFRAVARGSTVTEAEPRGKAAEEIRSLWKFLSSELARYHTSKRVSHA